ncbi:uncharacterized protein RAG0_04707 [Rhynchosporium agropyri]|uniref:Uncharacterized protein n=1 Tax=Rhynchosporium agropyri TaxID=914238 RepID=A0A1E1K9X0_9HELO|nr:uncharacterized protein RAG0_04707 [Rhynchosporium agropyri]
MKLSILIIGAGISGLAFVQGLLKFCIPFRVYDRNQALNVRNQRYRFRVHGGGQKALPSYLTPDLYTRLQACYTIRASVGDVAGSSPDAL